MYSKLVRTDFVGCVVQRKLRKNLIAIKLKLYQ